MAHVDDQRVARVLDVLEAQHPGAQLLVNDPWSIYYLTGFYADMFERFCGVLLARGAEVLILGCTELPLAFDMYALHYPTVDPTLELARAAIIAAGGKVKGEQSVSETKEDA